MSASPATVAGDDLPGCLDGASGGAITVEPPPRSWAAIKPGVLAGLRRLRAAGRTPPVLRGYPPCAIGTEHRELRPADEPVEASRYFPACAACGMRTRCSPPAAWNDELVPFGSGEPWDLWSRFHERFARIAGIARRGDVDDLIRRHLRNLALASLPGPCTIEPSLALEAALAPVVRAGVFAGPLPRGEAAARQAGAALVAGLADVGDAFAGGVPPPVLEALRRHGPFPLPLGVEAAPARPLLLKAYAQLLDVEPARRAALAGSLASLAGSHAAARVAALLDQQGTADLDMIGLGFAGGSLVSLKLYLARDPVAGWPGEGLPAVEAAHPLAVLSDRRAYAVLDLLHPVPRPPKWDFPLRHHLLTAPLVGRRLASLADPAAAAQLAELCAPDALRTDVVAAAIRGRALVLYVELA